VRSRCQRVDFAPPTPESLARRLGAALPGADDARLLALARLGGGDLNRALLLGTPTGERLRARAEACSRAVLSGDLAGRPWTDLLALAAELGKTQGAAVSEAADERASELGKGRDADRIRREGAEAAKRAERRARTAAVDLALALVASWFTDVIAYAEGAPELARNVDRSEELAADSQGVDPLAAREAAELAMATRARLRVNVNEELALDALFHRAARALGDGERVL